MSTYRLSIISALAVFAFASGSIVRLEAAESKATQVAQSLSEAYAEVAEKVLPAVVGIKAEKLVKIANTSPFGNNGPEEEILRKFFGERSPLSKRFKIPSERRIPGMGSGVIVDKQGHILTNNHVVEGEEVTLEVMLNDDRKYNAKVIGTDPKTDLAVIKLLDFEGDLPVATLGDSDKLRVGNIVLAIGSPFQLRQSVTAGIVSAKNRSINDATFSKMMYQDFIQTDASINPGNSGGPLVNLYGEVVGINTAIRSGGGGSDGIGFSVPVNQVKVVMSQLIKDGKVTRGWLGVGIDSLTPELAEQFPGVDEGVLVRDVYGDTPAGKAGVKHGDVIVEFSGKKVRSPQELQNIVAMTEPDKEVKMVVVRDGKRKELSVVVAKQPDDLSKIAAGGTGGDTVQPGTAKSELLGLSIQELSDDLREKFELPEEQGGVIVTSVENDSDAYRKGIRAGAVIIEMNREPVTSADDFSRIEKSLNDKKNVLLYVRQGTPRYVVLSLK